MKRSLLSIIKSIPTAALVFFLLSFFESTKLQAQITISPWKMNADGGVQLISPALPFHGASAAYAYAVVPAINDPNWVNAPLDGSGNVAFSQPSALPGNRCLSAVDFTFFQTLITIPPLTAINTFTVSFSQVDDGARAYIFNSAHPSGAFISGGDIVLGGPPVTANLASLAVAGEVNRIVIAQFDDCATENNVRGVQVIVNGTPIPVAASISCPSDIVVNNTPGQCGANVTFPPAVADGNPTPTITYSQASGSFFPVGTTVVTATATNATSTASCSFNVTVNGPVPSCSIASVPSDNTYTGGVSTNLYLGYGPQSTTLQVTPTGGSGGYTYAWSPATGLSDATSGAPVFTPTAEGKYTFTVTVTDKCGISTTCSITICVLDIRVPESNGKVYVCHTPPGNPTNVQTLSISVNAVSAHIFNPGHGDHLGRCDQTPCGAASSFTTRNNPGVSGLQSDAFILSAAPNPSAGYFNVLVKSGNQNPVEVRVTDVLGRVVFRQTNVMPNTNLRIGEKFGTGGYLIEAVKGANRQTLKVLKAQ